MSRPIDLEVLRAGWGLGGVAPDPAPASAEPEAPVEDPPPDFGGGNRGKTPGGGPTFGDALVALMRQRDREPWRVGGHE